jgi:hypothetical protein
MIKSTLFPPLPSDWSPVENYLSGSAVGQPTKVVPPIGVSNTGHFPDQANIAPEHINYLQHTYSRHLMAARDAMLLPDGVSRSAKNISDTRKTRVINTCMGLYCGHMVPVDPYRSIEIYQNESVWVIRSNLYPAQASTTYQGVASTSAPSNATYVDYCLDSYSKTFYLHCGSYIYRKQFELVNTTAESVSNASIGETPIKIASHNGVFIRCRISGDTGEPIVVDRRSSTGTWTSATLLATGHATRFAVFVGWVPATFGWAGGFVIVLRNGNVYTSPDGATWTLRNAGNVFAASSYSSINNANHSLLLSAVVVGTTIIATQPWPRDVIAGIGLMGGWTYISDDWGNTWRAYNTPSCNHVSDGGDQLIYQYEQNWPTVDAICWSNSFTNTVQTSKPLIAGSFLPQASADIPSLVVT